MIDNTQLKKLKNETLAMKSVNDWLNQMEKIGTKRNTMGMGVPFSQATPPQDTLMDKMSRMFEKKQEMEMMAQIMGDFVGKDGKKPSEKKVTPQAQLMKGIAELIAKDPDGASQLLERLDEDTLNKLAFLNNPDPNAALIRSIVENKGSSEKAKPNQLMDFLKVYQALNSMNNPNKPDNGNNNMMLELIKLFITQQGNNQPQENSSVIMLQEFLRTERESRIQAQQNAELARQEMNNTMLRYLDEKRSEAVNRPSATEEFIHMLNAIGTVKEGFGNVVGGSSQSPEMRKMDLQQERWRIEKELERDQRNTMFSMISGIADRVADVAAQPLGDELKKQFSDKARSVGQNLVATDLPVTDPIQDDTVNNINNETIPQRKKHRFVIPGENE